MHRTTRDFAAEAIVVLGCPVHVDAGGRLRPGPLARRLDAAVHAYAHRTEARTIVIASGGRHWNGLVEADVMARELAWRGVPEAAIARERCSLSTRDNARLTALSLAHRGIESAAVVTCDWHLPRALALFRRAGVRVHGVAAHEATSPPLRERLWRLGRERLLLWLEVPTSHAWSARPCGARAGATGDRVQPVRVDGEKPE
jgi:uncharacterized SAM-binding protein YcdF (DUF218 family)